MEDLKKDGPLDYILENQNEKKCKKSKCLNFYEWNLTGNVRNLSERI